MKDFDVVIIGGGASGLCCAIRIKQALKTAKVAVVEQLPRVAKKLITTGNGRCNITNKNIDVSRYHSENTDFCKAVLEKYGLEATAEFFENIGIVFTYDETGRAYPYSLQASSVVDALRFAAEENGVEIFTETAVKDIKKDNNGYVVLSDNDRFCAKNVVVAAGLLSGGKKVGSDGSLIRILKNMGYKTVKMTPAIVQIKTATETVRQLKGIKVNAVSSLVLKDKVLRSEYGEVLFCEYGLSGPPILQISRGVERNFGGLTVNLDLIPEYDKKALTDALKRRKSLLKYRTNDEFLTGLLNKRVGQVIIKLCGLSAKDTVIKMSKTDIENIANMIKSFSFKVTGTTGFENSQVTAGGLENRQFNPSTLMSAKDKGLYAIGEILDVDGDCGGFNLQWAWSSAFCAADSIVRSLEK